MMVWPFLLQEEELADGLQLEPPGMHLIYLPYADDIRPTEKYHICSEASVPRASKEQVEAAAAFINKMKLDSWSVFDISDPAMQRHYAILQAIALEQEEESLLEATDTTLPDSKGIMRATSAVQAFKDAVYGPQHDQEEADAAAERAKGSIASQKRKAAAEVACKEAQNYDWGELADTGKVDILMSAQCATLFNDEQSNEVTYS
jgi:ATP-dependent DNA helicase 2 subunit 1